jgi:hypothetical protein
MKPVIIDSGFGCITVEDSKIDYDIIIRFSGEIKKRKKTFKICLWYITYYFPRGGKVCLSERSRKADNRIRSSRNG